MKKDKIMGTKKWMYWVSIGIVLIVVYKFFDNFAGIGNWLGKFLGVLAPLLTGVLIAYILYKPCKLFEKIFTKGLKIKSIKIARFISITIVYALFIGVLFALAKFIIPAIYDSVSDLVANVQYYYNGIATDSLETNIAPFIKENIIKPLVELIQGIEFKQYLSPDRLIDYASTVVGAIKVIGTIIIALICSIRILFERDSLAKYIDRLAKAVFSKEGYKRFNRYYTNGNDIFLKYISAQFLDALVVAVIMSIALAIMKVKYAVLLGVIIGLFNLIPYFGAVVGILIAVLITILTGGWNQAILMTVVTIILQQIDAQIINPKITGTNLEVSPLLVVVSVVIGGAYFGWIGMLLSVPVAVLIRLMLNDFIINREKDKESVEIEEKNDEKIDINIDKS